MMFLITALLSERVVFFLILFRTDNRAKKRLQSAVLSQKLNVVLRGLLQDYQVPVGSLQNFKQSSRSHVVFMDKTILVTDYYYYDRDSRSR